MNKELRRAITNGSLTLFLGAGASKNCKTNTGEELPDGAKLASILAEQADLQYNDEPLDVVYSAVRYKLGARLDSLIEDLFKFTSPSDDYLRIAQFAWRRIYTLNIDDALDRALQRQSTQHVDVQIGIDSIRERAPLFERLDFVKLNGSVHRLRDGIIFSPSEYAQATARVMPWYEELAADFMHTPFLFVGTKLNEPLLKFHVERFKQIHGKAPGMSFVLTPSITDIQRLDLLNYNLIHIPGTLTDFTRWLVEEFPKPLGTLDLAKAALPQLAELLAAPHREQYASLFERVSIVKRTLMSSEAAPAPQGAVLPFYKGFKPRWSDIINGVPAELVALGRLLRRIDGNETNKPIIPIVGPAGAGKTTLLMQAALRMSDKEGTAVYFISEPIDRLQETLEALERTSQSDRVIVAMDKIDFVAEPLADAFASGRLKKTCVVGTESQSTWHKKTKHHLQRFASGTFVVSEITKADADPILSKLEQFGSWTVLGQLTAEQRRHELLTRAKKQLLIALLEATSGRGYEQIIERDYQSLTTDDERLFFIVVGLATISNLEMPEDLASRAMTQMDLRSHMSEIVAGLSGIIIHNGDRLFARHSIYVRYLLTTVIDPRLVHRALHGLLKAFAHYRAPVIQHMTRIEAAIYKSIINHVFLFDVLQGRHNMIHALYAELEKRFEHDGLFWLQYGLALRDAGDHPGALEKLRVAQAAYPMPHTLHAVAQQLLILGPMLRDKHRATAYLDEARELLEGLDEVIDSDDTYPIVTLAEGHTKMALAYDGKDVAREIAKSYAATVKGRLERDPSDHRLRECWQRLFKFAAIGTWPRDALRTQRARRS